MPVTIPQFTIEEMTVETIDPATIARRQSWIDTYVNEPLGVTTEWIEAYFADRLLPETKAAREERFALGKQAGTFTGWVALNEASEIIGSATCFIKEDGAQELASIYVNKEWHGTGVGAALMRKMIDWFDPDIPIELGVVSYNARAQAFYRKWGFEEIPNSETIFADKLPEIRMKRPVSNQLQVNNQPQSSTRDNQGAK